MAPGRAVVHSLPMGGPDDVSALGAAFSEGAGAERLVSMKETAE